MDITLALQESLLAGDAGEFWAWGHGQYGQLGNGNQKQTRTLPFHNHVMRGIDVIQVDCGFRHTVFLTDQGEVYACGCNSFGQLGLGDTRDRSSPERVGGVLLNARVVHIACGLQHTACVTSSGHCFTWGMDNKGQLGRSQDPRIPGLVGGIPEAIIKVALGQDHTVFVTKSGSLYSCGRGSEGELGFSQDQHHEYVTPRRLVALDGVVITDVACGVCFSIAISNESRLYSWGANDLNQCAQDRSGEGVLSPLPIRWLGGKKIVQIATGWSHAACLNSEGEMYAWGGNSEGQCGLGECSVSVPRPRLVTALSGQAIRHVALGWRHTVVVNDIGDVMLFGSNYSYQLGHDEHRGTQPVPQMVLSGKHVGRRVASGGEHVICFLDTGMSTPLSSDIGSLLTTETPNPLADVQFDFPDGRSIYAHQAILRARSGVFQTQFLFRRASREERRIITVDDWSFEAFYCMLAFIYTDALLPMVGGSLAAEVSRLADEHTLPRLSALCRRITSPTHPPHPLPVSSLALDLQALLNNVDVADVVFLVGKEDEENIYAHQCILVARGGPEFCDKISLTHEETSPAILAPFWIDESVDSEVRLFGGAAGTGMDESAGSMVVFSPEIPPPPPLMRASSMPEVQRETGEARVLTRGLTLPAITRQLVDSEAILMAAENSVGDLNVSRHDSDDCVQIVRISGDITSAAFNRVLLYLYTGDLHTGIDERSAFEVMVAASRLGIEPLKAACSCVLQRTVRFENVTYLFQVAKLTDSPRLRMFCLHFMITQYDRLAELGFLGLMAEDMTELKARRMEEMGDNEGEGSEAGQPQSTSLGARLRRTLRLALPRRRPTRSLSIV